MSSASINKSALSLTLTGVLFLVAIVFLFFPGPSQETSLWIDILFFSCLNIGFLVALGLGMKTKRKSIVIFSLLVNSMLFMIGLLFITTYLFVIMIT